MPFITDLISKITNFRVKIGDKLNTLKNQIGQLNSLTTNNKTSLVGAINEVNNIQIGGRNLLLQTTTSEINLVGGVDIYAEKAYKISNLEKNTEYIFSVIAKGDEMTLISFIPNVIVDYKSLTTEFKLYTWKFSTSNEPAILDFLIRSQVGKNITITKAKLEKGNKSTDWTPAPEDQVSNWAETDSNSLSFIKGKEIVNNEFNNVYDQISSRANNRLSNLASDLTADEKGTIRDKIGVVLPTVNDGKLTLTTGTGLNGSTNFTANQSSNSIFDVSIASTHKLPTVEEWNALPTTSTITRLRGTTSGTYTSGDLTLLAGSNVSIAQSGNNFTINATDTNTTYTASNGLTLTGTVFSLPVTTSGSGNVVSAITQTTNGISVSKGISAMTTSHIANNINQNLGTSSSPTFIKINSLNLKGRGSLGTPLDILTGNKLSTYVFEDVSDKNALGTFRVESNITKDGGIPVFTQWGASILAQSGDTMFTLSANPNTPEIFVSAGNTTNNVTWNKKLAFSTNEFPLYAQAFYENSLRELKENIKPFNKSGLELINSLDIVTFDRKDSEVKNKIGIIADDSIEEVLSTKKDAVDLYNTVFIQAKAIQELDNKNKILEERISQLEELIKNIL